MVNDTVADLLTRIKNAQMRQYDVVHAPYSKLSEAVLNILLKEKFILNFEIVAEEDKADRKIFNISLKYVNGKPGIEKIKKVSKPGRRNYIGYREIRKVLNGLGISILSTPKGVMTGKDAREQRVGGEYICEVY